MPDHTPEDHHEPETEGATPTQHPFEARILELEADLEAANNERLRAIADFQNFRRRSQAELSQFRTLATENLISELLPVLDNFERTIEHLQADTDPERILQGIQAVERQLRTVLESQNLKRIDALGQPFDPHLHDAISVEVDPDVEPDTVIAELQSGYAIGDRVIRASKVKVAKPE